MGRFMNQLKSQLSLTYLTQNKKNKKQEQQKNTILYCVWQRRSPARNSSLSSINAFLLLLELSRLIGLCVIWMLSIESQNWI